MINGELFFDTLLLTKSGLDNIEQHIVRFIKTVSYLECEPIINQEAAAQWYYRQEQLLQYGAGSRVRISFSRNGHGFSAVITQDYLGAPIQKAPLVISPQRTRQATETQFNFKLTDNIERTVSHEAAQAYDSIIINSNNEVCETTKANIYILTSTALLTPPLSCSVLAGTIRAKLMDASIFEQNDKFYQVKAEIISLDQLLSAKEIYISNSLIGIIPAIVV